MRCKYRLLMAFVVGSLVTAGNAAPPDGKGKPDKGGDDEPPAAFSPEILYRIDAGKDREIRFGNREGDQAVLIHRGSPGESFDASSTSPATPQPNMIAYHTGGTIYLTEWSTQDGFSLSPSRAIHTSTGRIGGLAFSNADDKIVFDNGGAGLSVYIIPEGDIYGGSVTTYIGDNFNVIFPRWSPDDKSVYFYGGPYVAEQWVTGLYRYDLASDTLTEILSRTNEHSLYLDVTEAPDGSTLIATGLNGALQLYDGAGNEVVTAYSPAGDNFEFNCDGSAVLHSQWGNRGNMLVISELAGGSSVYAERKVSPISSWMPVSPCP